MTSEKRSDLQGIRGFAILSVLLFHFFPKSFPNGYIGVDQFFVLSGFLISMVLSRSDSVDFRQFYYRRIKRIVPLYLLVVLFIICALFSVFPASNLAINLESARNALLFVTNFAGSSSEKRYAIMLSTAEDCFTHTWSLSVEMQFYLLVPLIFTCSKTHRPYTVMFICSGSIVFSFLVDSDTAFNSVLARLWQFLIGFAVFNMSNQEATPALDEESCNLLEDSEENGNGLSERFGRSSNTLTILAYSVLLACILLPFWLTTIPSVVLRPSVTVLTAFLIYIGSRPVQLAPLCNPYMVYVGDVSYALYLVHWPIYAYIKLNLEECTSYSFAGLLVALLVAVLLKETFERLYLSMNTKSIIALLLVLYTANFGMLTLSYFDPSKTIDEYGRLNMSSDYKNETDMNEPWHMYDNITRAEAIRLNNQWTSVEESYNHNNCSLRDRSGDTMLGCDFKIASNVTNGLPKMMIIGNSYAANVVPTIADVCAGDASQISIFWRSGCETLIDTTTIEGFGCSGTVDRYVSIVRQENPDVLVMMNRHLDLMHVVETGTSPVNDSIYLTAAANLRRFLHSSVQKIFIFDSLPRPYHRLTVSLLNEALESPKNGTVDLPMSRLVDPADDYRVGRDRLRQLVREECPKRCQLVDAMSTFTGSNGEFQFFDPNNGLTYFLAGIHFSPYGKMKLEPVFREMCRQPFF